MNFTDIVEEVIEETKRRDKVTSIRREVNNAINFCCINSNFARDLEETSLSVDATVYSQSVALSELPRFRKVCWLRQEGEDCFMLPLDITADLKRRSSGWVDKFYVSGDNLIFKTSKLNGTLEIGYFKYPPILTDDEPDFWLLDISPYMIIERACSKIFNMIGDEASARVSEAAFRQSLLTAQADFTYGINKGR